MPIVAVLVPVQAGLAGAVSSIKKAKTARHLLGDPMDFLSPLALLSGEVPLV